MPLPTFVIAGAQKSATTTLHGMLSQHPEIYMTDPKELHFFDSNFERGLDWYADQFKPGPGQSQTGESTPFYMYNDLARERMLTCLPEARFVVILREPASRAYSHYWFSREKGVEKLETFERAIRRESARLARSSDGQPHARSYVDRGFYIDQIEAIAAVAGRERLKVFLMEDLTDSPTETLTEVLEFLRVDPSCVTEIEMRVANRFGQDGRRSWGTVERRDHSPNELAISNYPTMRDDTRMELRARYREANERLAVWLGRDLSHWY